MIPHSQLRFVVITILLTLAVACSKGSNADAKSDSPVHWLGLKEGIKKAQSEKKLIFVDLYADWCGPCKYMDATTYRDSVIVKTLNTDFVPVKLNADSKETIKCEDEQITPMECAAKVWNVQGLPGTIILDADGYFLTSTMGAQEAGDLSESLNMLLGEKDKLLTFVAEEKRKQQEEQTQGAPQKMPQ